MLDTIFPADPVNATPWINAKATRQATVAANARQASVRRRGVDPTTCERNYQADVLEFMTAIQAYKKSSGRMFPTWSEVLEAIGYERTSAIAIAS